MSAYIFESPGDHASNRAKASTRVTRLGRLAMLVLTIGAITIGPGASHAALVAHYKFDGDFSDSTGSQPDAVQAGTAGPVTFDVGLNGSAARFPTASGQDSSWLTVADLDGDLNLTGGTGLTLSVWVFKEAAPFPQRPVIFKGNLDNTQGVYDLGAGSQPGADRARINLNGSGQFTSEVSLLSPPASVPLGEWQHLVARCDFTADTLQIFVNGVSVAQSDCVAAMNPETNDAVSPLVFGKRFGPQNNNFVGLMDEIRIYDEPLSDAAIANLADRTRIGLVAHYEFDGDFLDSSGNGNHGTATLEENPFVAGSVGFMKGIRDDAAVFDGSSYVNVPPDPSLDLDNHMTVAAWINPDSGGFLSEGVVFKGSITQDPIAPHYNFGSYELLVWSNGDLRAIFADDPETLRFEYNEPHLFLEPSDPKPVKFFWQHVAAVYDGTDVVFYVDGVEVGRDAFPEGILPQPTEDLNIGRRFKAFDSGDGDGGFAGKIDDVRIYYGALSRSEIAALAHRPDLEIALSGDPAPCTGCGDFDVLGAPAVNLKGEAAFAATLTSGPLSGLFTASPAPQCPDRKIATTDDASPGDASLFTGFRFDSHNHINNQRDVLFQATRVSGNNGIFLAEAAKPAPILHEVAVIGGCTDTSTYVSGGQVDFGANEANQIAWVANDGLLGIFVDGSGGCGTRIVDTSIPVPGGLVGEAFQSFGDPAINNDGHVAFMAVGDMGTEGLFFYDGIATTAAPFGVSKVVFETDTVGAITIATIEASAPALNDADEIVFSGATSGDEGHYRARPNATAPQFPSTVIEVVVNDDVTNSGIVPGLDRTYLAPFQSDASISEQDAGPADATYFAAIEPDGIDGNPAVPNEGIFLNPEGFEPAFQVALVGAPSPDGGTYVEFGNVSGLGGYDRRPAIMQSVTTPQGVRMPASVVFHASTTATPGGGIFLPEPGSVLSLICGGVTLAALRRRRMRVR